MTPASIDEDRAAPSPPPLLPIAPHRPLFAPAWLQGVLIVGLLGAAVFVGLNGRYLWAGLLAVAGLAFGVSFVLRRMVGDEYDRT